MINGIAFDLEGTIVNVERLHFGGFAAAAHDHGIELSTELIMKKVHDAIGGGDELIAKGIAELSGYRVQAGSILEAKRAHYNRLVGEIERIEPRPGFLDVLAEVKRMGLPIAIGSITPRSQAAVLLERSGIACHFPSKMIVLKEDTRNHKPAPDVYLETARRMEIKPEDQLVFEDSAVGLRAAVAAGSIGVGIPVYDFRENLVAIANAGAARIFLDWREIQTAPLISNLGVRQ